MGFCISWLAVRGCDKPLLRLGLYDTDIEDCAHKSPVTGAPFPNGWYVVFMNDILHPFVEPAFLRRLSKGCEVVASQVVERATIFYSSQYNDGRQIWKIDHELKKGSKHLEYRGCMPPAFKEIKRRVFAEEDERRNTSVRDYVYKVPIETAYSVCGYRYDCWETFDWGRPRFTRLETAPTDRGWAARSPAT